MSFLCLKESRGRKESGGGIRGVLACAVSGHKDSSPE